MDEEKVTYKRQNIIDVLKDLNIIVVSLDRLGSEYSINPDRKSDEELNALLANFIFEWKVTEKIAKARKVLDGAFARKLDESDMDELEREFQNLQYWSSNNPSPPNKRVEKVSKLRGK